LIEYKKCNSSERKSEIENTLNILNGLKWV
jgi:hypothetical protein